MAEIGNHIFERAATCQLETDTAVARQVAGRREDEIAGTGEAHEGFRLPAERRAKPRDFGKAARDQRRARIQPQAQAIGDAGGDRHHVLHRAADLDADQIRAVVDPHASAVQQRRGFARERGVARGKRERAGQAARDLFRERRP